MTRPTIDDPVLLGFAAEVGTDDQVTVRGGGTRWEVGGPVDPAARVIRAPVGIVDVRPDEMTAHVRAGTTVAELHGALAEAGQTTALAESPDSTVGGAIAVGHSPVTRLGRGHSRDAVLQVRYVDAAGRLVTGGGPTVKNVTGFDLPRLLFGSLGTLGCMADVIVRTRPVPEVEHWYRVDGADPAPLRAALPTAASMLWDGESTWTLLAGYAVDVADDLDRLRDLTGGTPVEDPPPHLPPFRWSRRPRDLRRLGAEAGSFVAEVGVGVVHSTRPDPEPTPMPAGVKALNRRVRDVFDPDRRFNPGRSVEMG